MMDTNQRNLTQLLIEIINRSYKVLTDLDESELRIRPAAGKWSKQEILGHLIDSALNNHRRFIIALHQDHLVFDGYDQEMWVRINDYHSYVWEKMLDYWVMSNMRIIAVIQSYPEEKFMKKFGHHNFHRIAMRPVAQDKPASLKYLFADYIYHLEHHLGQILEGYDRLLKEVC